jgi:hypothetical protein
MGAKAKLALTVALLVLVTVALVSPATGNQKGTDPQGIVPPPVSTSASQPSVPPSASPSEEPTTPLLYGFTVRKAKEVLASVGLEWKITYRVVGEDEAGVVLSQSPSAGSSLQPGHIVTLAVGKAGPKTPVGLVCPSNALLGVYHSYRLTVLSTCKWVVGTVVKVTSEKDGDHHVNVLPDKGYAGLLNSGDLNQQDGALVTEIMKGQSLPVPSVGEHISLFGTWVLDENHGWNEIHPIWGIKYLDTGELVYKLPPNPPKYNPDEGGGGGGGGGSNCDPSYPTVCIPSPPPDLDCGDIAYSNFQVVGADPHGFDGDNDGIGCET